MRAYPTWEQFDAKFAQGKKEDFFQALCRLLFKEKYGIVEAIPYAFNHAGNEMAPIVVGKEVVGFQAKYFTGNAITDAQADDLIDSINTAGLNNPEQTKILIYTTLPFGNPLKGQTMTNRQAKIESAAQTHSMSIEWIQGDNILDLVAKDELLYDLFFNNEIDLIHLNEHLKRANEIQWREIKNVIRYGDQTISLSRQDMVNQLEGLLSQHKHVIVAGESGSGKSAIVKDYCLRHQNDAVFVWINAGQLNTNDVNSLFHYEESYTLQNVKSYYSRNAKKVLIIDSSEKLLSARGTMAYSLLIDSLIDDDWQVIFTVRKSRVDAFQKSIVDLQEIKTEILEVYLISDSTIDAIFEKYTIAKPSNKKLYQRIHNLFYLARYCELSHDQSVSYSDFLDSIWEEKIKGSVDSDISKREAREQCILECAKRILHTGNYLIRKEGLDLESISELIQDEVISNDRYSYQFAHDIYLDWALNVYLDILWERTLNVVEFFKGIEDNIIGFNAFRNWIAHKVNNQADLVRVFEMSLFSEELIKKWRSVVITAILRSDSYSPIFFNAYKEKLKADEYRWGAIVLSELVVNCQEIVSYIKYKDINYPMMCPVGSGWDSAIDFINEDFDYLRKKYGKLVNAILKHYHRLRNANPKSLQIAAKMALQPHKEIAEIRKQGRDVYYENPEIAWSVAVNYFGYILPEIKQILDEIIVHRWVNHLDPYSELSRYIAKSQDISLAVLYMHYPKEILDLMDIYWSASNDNDEDDVEHGRIVHSDYRVFEPEEAWGLSHERLMLTYFPVSGLQTCINMMLLLHPKATVDFLISFIDKCVHSYAAYDWESDPVTQIEITLFDGTKRTKLGNQTAWNLYRGTSGISTPDLLKCIHMALERYILDIAKENRKDEVREILDKIIDKAESISLLAIVASVVVCHPNDYFEEAIALTSNLLLLGYDLHRSTRELSANLIEFAYRRNLAMLDERRKSNALPHRKRHLEDVLCWMQVSLEDDADKGKQQRLQRVYKNVDMLKEQLDAMSKDEKDLFGFILLRCDVRAMTKEHAEVDGVPVVQYVPNLSDEQKRLSEKSRSDSDKMMLGVSLRMWVTYHMKGRLDKLSGNEYENNPLKALSDSKQIKEQLMIQPGGLSLLPGDEYVPSMVCALMLMDYIDKLSNDDIEYCEDEVINALLDVDSMVDSEMSSFIECMSAINSILGRTHRYDDQIQSILQVYSSLENEVDGQRCCDIVANAIVAYKLWENYSAFMQKTLVSHAESIAEKKDISNITSEDAESLLCLMATYPLEEDMQELANISLEILSHVWDDDDKRHGFYYGTRVYASNTVARMILSAPKDVISELVSYYARYINTNGHDTMLMSFVLQTLKTNDYGRFWIAWKAFYPTIVLNRRDHRYSDLLNNYMLNPTRYSEWSDDWFVFQKQDLDFYRNIAHDIGNEPIVLRNIVVATNTIAKKYLAEMLSIIYYIVANNGQMDMRDMKSEILTGLERICRSITIQYSQELSSSQNIRNQFIDVLDFMIRNDSAWASNIKNTL